MHKSLHQNRAVLYPSDRNININKAIMRTYLELRVPLPLLCYITVVDECFSLATDISNCSG